MPAPPGIHKLDDSFNGVEVAAHVLLHKVLHKPSLSRADCQGCRAKQGGCTHSELLMSRSSPSIRVYAFGGEPCQRQLHLLPIVPSSTPLLVGSDGACDALFWVCLIAHTTELLRCLRYEVQTRGFAHSTPTAMLVAMVSLELRIAACDRDGLPR